MTLVLGRVSGRRATDWGTWTWFLHVEGRGCSATPDRCRLREHLMSGHALDNLLPLDVAVFPAGSGSEEASVCATEVWMEGEAARARMGVAPSVARRGASRSRARDGAH